MLPEPGNSCVLRDARIVTLDPSLGIVEGDLVVEDGSIAAVGGSMADPPDREIDVGGDVVIPGFVQCHIHLCQTLLRGGADDMALIEWLSERVWPYEASITPKELYVSARVGLAELALSGTTALLDMGTVRGTDAVASAVEESGLRAIIGKCMMDRGEGAPDELVEETDASLARSVEACRRWDGAADGRIGYAFAPRFAVSCTDALLRDTARAAEQLGAGIHTHASETQYENEFTTERFGVRNVPYLNEVDLCGPDSVFAHGVHVTEDERRLLAETETSVCHCPSSNLKLASGVADVPALDRDGVQLGLGADGAPCNNNLDPFVEMRLAALIHKPGRGPEAMPARRVLELATLDGARALGLEDEVGSIEEGKRADLVVLDLDSDPACAPAAGNVYSRIAYSAQKSNVRDVFVDGRRVVADGRLVGVDRKELLDRAQTARRSIAERM
ncbi:MAG: 5'-deoxyadenosine deaminase [Bradymonadaceae bacterium]